MRVIHIINRLTLGGAEAILYRLVTRDTANEHVVVSLGREGWYSSRLRERGIPLHHLNMDSVMAAPSAMARLHRLMRHSGPDVVQCWMYRSNIFGGVVAKLASKPVIWGIHCSSLEPLRPSSRALVHLGGLLARWVPDFIVNCSTRSEEIHARLGYSAAEGAVVHNGYDASTFFPSEEGRKGARKALGLTPNVFTIASIARWHPQKDLRNLFAALRLVRERGIEFRCLLVGAGLGRDNKELIAAIAQSGCSEWVVPLGPRSDIPNVARALDLHVLASCGGEAFPNVVAETMLSETPNVVTDVGDSAFMVGQSGWVVPPRYPQHLADAIIAAHREWKGESGRWEGRRKAARERIERKFSIDGMARAYEDVWRRVVAHRSLSEAPAH